MVRVVLRRVAEAVLVFWGATVLAFFLIHIAPGSAAVVRAGGAEATSAEIARAEEALGLNRPLLEQYLDMMSGLLRGDLGTSWLSSAQVVDELALRIPATLSVALGALVVGLLIAVPTGMVAALNPGKLTDKLVVGFVTLGIATPEFFIGVLLVLFFAVTLGLLPAVGYVPPDAGLDQWFLHLLLPWVTLGIGSAAQLSRHLRASMRDVLGSDFVRTAHARGLPTRRVVMKHALKNAAIPVVTILGLQTQALLAGSVIIETVFAIRGVGALLISATTGRDLPMIQGIVLLVVLTIVVVNFLMDMTYLYLNPKLRES